jgi:YtcA family
MMERESRMRRMLIGTGSLAAGCSLLSGCGQAPSVEVIGSFFPVWMLCVAIAVVLAFVLRYVLLRLKLESEVGPLALFYPSAVVLFTSLLWLIFFR